tara:strand:- start:186 stop:431 length:246 start_codon:yes stop_codon:yes gene_type:complete
MKMPTIGEIKDSGVLGEHFFSPATMEFFGQKMSSFELRWYDKDYKIIELRAKRWSSRGTPAGLTERFLQIRTGGLVEVFNP